VLFVLMGIMVKRHRGFLLIPNIVVSVNGMCVRVPIAYDILVAAVFLHQLYYVAYTLFFFFNWQVFN